jgi:hypothetical protein
MATECTPSVLVAGAKCFDCLNGKQRDLIKTYLLAVIAGGSTDPATLLALAKCFDCLSRKQLRMVQAYLLCQIVNK